MPYQTPNRNREGVRWQGIRDAADLATAEMDDEVSRAYYDKWKLGLEFQWGPWNVLPTPEENLEQFNLLSAMVQAMHLIAFHNINRKMNQNGNPNAIPQDDYRYVYQQDHDEEGNPVGDPYLVRDNVAEAQDQMVEYTAALGVSTQQMRDHYLLRVKELSGYDIDWSID